MARIENHYNTVALVLDPMEFNSTDNAFIIDQETLDDYFMNLIEGNGLLIPIACIEMDVPDPRHYANTNVFFYKEALEEEEGGRSYTFAVGDFEITVKPEVGTD